MALAIEPVQFTAAGQVVHKSKIPWFDGATPLVISRLQFMERLAAQMPSLHLTASTQFAIRLRERLLRGDQLRASHGADGSAAARRLETFVAP